VFDELNEIYHTKIPTLDKKYYGSLLTQSPTPRENQPTKLVGMGRFVK
jgi:hypothetical protein